MLIIIVTLKLHQLILTGFTVTSIVAGETLALITIDSVNTRSAMLARVENTVIFI